MEKTTSRILILWMALIVVSISSLYDKMNSESKRFYMFGPNNNLIVFGLEINTYSKYFVIVTYCLINSLLRTSCRDILISWQINNVQDITKYKNKEISCFAYEVCCVTTMYMWIDWYIYMNLLLAQVDMLIIEISSDLLMSCIITKYYLNYKVKGENVSCANDTCVMNIMVE
uniref:Uncharacterized protein n=1 Tax=viral metagenome TaxID=1070528 RepID=A0A6C0LNQ0_9ZZZZ